MVAIAGAQGNVTGPIPNEAGQSEVWILVQWEELVTYGFLPEDPTDDKVMEFSSLDWIDDFAGSNHNDGNMFDALMESSGYQRRGKARGIKEGQNGNIAIFESPAGKDFMKAGGVQFIQFRVPNIAAANGTFLESEPRHIQNQANYLYYSGHGSHQEGTLLNADNLTPAEAAQHWNQELHTVIISGCSVLDIRDHAEKWVWHDALGPIRALASPGEKWLKTGPKLLLGYAYTAPLDFIGNDQQDPSDDDPDGTAKIIQLWFDKGKTAKAWMYANEEVKNKYGTQIGTNACAIDLMKDRWTYYFFKATVVRKKGGRLGLGHKYLIEAVSYNAILDMWFPNN